MTLGVQDAVLKFGRTRVLSHVTLDIAAGTVTALVGPNGAGKTSLMRVLAGEVTLTHGKARLNGRPLNRMSAQEQARRRSVMMQSAAMAFDFHVEEILEMGWMQRCRKSFHRAAAQVASDCEIRHLIGRKYNTLSGGEQQRIQFARSLLQVWRPEKRTLAANGQKSVLEPFYLLLDEPTSSLDLAHELLVLRLARRASRCNIGTLLILHDLNLASRFADRIVLLVGGSVEATGVPEEVFTENILSRAYGTGVLIEWHRQLDRLVIHSS